MFKQKRWLFMSLIMVLVFVLSTCQLSSTDTSVPTQTEAMAAEPTATEEMMAKPTASEEMMAEPTATEAMMAKQSGFAGNEIAAQYPDWQYGTDYDFFGVPGAQGVQVGSDWLMLFSDTPSGESGDRLSE